MSRYYDKNQLKEQLELAQIYDLLEAWGGNPVLQGNQIISETICHNLPGEGSNKLYYYDNSKLFSCYTNCNTFDIFELYIKIQKIQYHRDCELYDAMNYIASYFGLEGIEQLDKEESLEDWKIFKRYDVSAINSTLIKTLPEYDKGILTRFLYPRIIHWEKEGILPEITHRNFIGYYPGKEQITIPHFDINNRLIGIRGRALSVDEAERYGKYRPLLISHQLYNHPLSMNLYNLNNSKDNIQRAKTAIVFESEKAALLYQSYYGIENDISVAVCGNTLSNYQVRLLKNLGVNEIIIAFDRDFEETSSNDDTFLRLKNKLIQLYQKYHNLVRVTAIFDKHKILPLKASPIDAGPEIFEQLLKERITPCE